MRLKYAWLYILNTLIIFFIPTISWAFCPVCTVAVAGGVGLSRWIGIDDAITGIWIGGLVISLIVWTNNWLRNKKWTFPGYHYVIGIIYYALIFIPLYYKEIIGHPYNQIWGIDKLVFGILLGGIGFLTADFIYAKMKKANQNKPYFQFQKIVTPILFLAILSAIFYFIIK